MTSVYGLSMKAAWVASKVVPDSVIVAVMEKICRIGGSHEEKMKRDSLVILNGEKKNT